MLSKAILERIVYEIDAASSFFVRSKAWSSPTWGFSYNQTRNSKLMDALMKTGIIQEKRSDVICMLADWSNVAEGIFLTDQALYVHSPKNRDKKFRVPFHSIKGLDYNPIPDIAVLKITTRNNSVHTIDTTLWSKRNIHLFLQIASGMMQLDEEDRRRLQKVDMSKLTSNTSTGFAAGVVYGNVSNASTLYGQDKFGTARGHGFAAERANHLFDKFTGKDARLVGDGNDKHGADRVVNKVRSRPNIAIADPNASSNVSRTVR
ncbi:hypothetical protein B1748_33100 [Paenibacillus sp. MY03]|uniref:hypothetical protein n=1 Tax=Paenibacillus sp. MY03 TaxID=302980 RepID=UPI000B3CBEB2|nr:hypothetical protein [Paenibacillus sp. MY03]OUS68693.1 hypothetical protein B1748_33100 [Paenibacillus sp. MY03]